MVKAGDGAEPFELPVVADCQNNVTIGRFEDLVGHDRRVGVAHPTGNGTGDVIRRGLVDEPGDRTVQQ